MHHQGQKPHSRVLKNQTCKVLKNLGGNVGFKLDLQQGDRILDLKLALFQATNLQLVETGLRYQHADNLVQIPVLDLQFYNSAFDRFDVFCVDHGY